MIAGPAPRPGLVFIPGYYLWNTGTYVWIDPIWSQPPVTGATWIQPEWEYDGSQWGLQEGYWQEPSDAAPTDVAPADAVTPEANWQEGFVQDAPPSTNDAPPANVASAPAPAPVAVYSGAPRIYIEPDTGLQSFLAAAVTKKHVPIIVTETKDDARFILSGNTQEKPESTGGKIARCLFVYCIGMEGSQTVSVRLTDTQTKEVVWAYTVRKANAQAYQSTAEAVAKHLKHFLEEHPQ